MTQIKYYDTSSGSWKAVVAGPSGAPGIVTSNTAPSDTSILWMDTSSSATQLAVPSGGSAGQKLVKSSNTDYATAWVDDTRAAGKNAIINGAFDIWQRGTNFPSYPYLSYGADRWQGNISGGTISQQALTPGTINGLDTPYHFRVVKPATLGYCFVGQKVEDVRTLAGQNVTLSFWAKAATNAAANGWLSQVFGAGGSTAVTSYFNYNLTTAWQKFTITIALPSVSGKTIGTNSHIEVGICGMYDSNGYTIDFAGVQLEAGSVATPFTRAGGTLQGELAACQRYYTRLVAGTAYGRFSPAAPAASTGQVFVVIPLPVRMRTIPTSIDVSSLAVWDGVNVISASGATLDAGSNTDYGSISVTASGLTQFRPYILLGSNSAAAYVGFSAEL